MAWRAALGILVATVLLGAGLQWWWLRRSPGTRQAAFWGSWGFAVVVGLTLTLLLVGESTGFTHDAPTFRSLRAHPDDALHGAIAFNALPTGSEKSGKSGCVMVMAASGRGPVTTLFCRPQPQARSAALRWLANGHLEATNRGSPRWRLDVDVATGAVTSQPWRAPAPIPAFPSHGPGGRTVSENISNGNLVLTLTRFGASRTLLRVAVPPGYTVSSPRWSPGGQWLVVETSGAQLVLITTGPHPLARLAYDRAEDAAIANVPLP